MGKNILYNASGIKFSRIDTYIEYTQPKHILMHSNDHYEIYFSHTQKPIYYYLDQQLYRLAAGDLIITPPGIQHCAFLEPGDTLDRTKIRIDTNVIERFPEFHDILLPQKEQTFHLPGESYQTCMQYICKMEFYAQQNNHFSSCHMVLESLSLLLFVQECMTNISPLTSLKYPKILQDILFYIQEDNRYLTLSGNREIAEHFHISENYIPRLFHLYYPVSLKTLLLNMKIQYALTALENGATVTEACYASGFSDCSHFIATFRRITGTTPGKYKSK